MGVLLNGALAGRVGIGREETLEDALFGYLDKRNGVVYISEFGEYAHPTSEGMTLLPSGSVLLNDRGRNTFGDQFLYRIEVIFRLHLSGRGSRHYFVVCRKWRRKWERKSLSIIWIK